VETTIVRQVSEVVHPMPAEFETVQDSLALLLDIGRIMQDTDGDGLTDIAEQKMMLDPRQPDTDGDGISDGQDKNPRFKSITSERSLLYQTLIENFKPGENGMMTINLAHPPVYEPSKEDSLYGNFDAVSLLVTDDKDLQGISLQNQTKIILSAKEYKEYQKSYPTHFIKSDCSRLYRCNGRRNTYKVSTSYLTGSVGYIVRKTKKGWKIWRLYSMIS